jgi:hypothetical protein
MISVIFYHHKKKNYMVIFMTVFQLQTFYETKLVGVLNYRHNYEMLYNISLIVTTSTTF